MSAKMVWSLWQMIYKERVKELDLFSVVKGSLRDNLIALLKGSYREVEPSFFC